MRQWWHVTLQRYLAYGLLSQTVCQRKPMILCLARLRSCWALMVLKWALIRLWWFSQCEWHTIIVTILGTWWHMYLYPLQRLQVQSKLQESPHHVGLDTKSCASKNGGQISKAGAMEAGVPVSTAHDIRLCQPNGFHKLIDEHATAWRGEIYTPGSLPLSPWAAKTQKNLGSSHDHKDVHGHECTYCIYRILYSLNTFYIILYKISQHQMYE